MSQKLVVDIGNSRIKIGKFISDELKEVKEYFRDELNDCLKYLKDYRNVDTIVSSTWIKEKEFIESAELKEAITVHNGLHYPIRFTYNQIWSLGKDRIAGAVAAHKLCSGKHNIIIDMGSCVTYDFVEKSGVHLGGMISPGLNMRFKSMHEMTARLPLVSFSDKRDFIADNTYDALHSGGKMGLKLEIEGFIRELKQLYSEVHVYVTGGDAQLLNSILPEDVDVDEDLILKGLKEILDWNDKNN